LQLLFTGAALIDEAIQQSSCATVEGSASGTVHDLLRVPLALLGADAERERVRERETVMDDGA